MTRTVLAALLAALVFVPAARSAEPRDAEWTFMLYWAGDNNLEFRTVANIKSMMEFGSNEKVNLLVFADRHPAGAEKRGFTNDPIGNIGNFDGAKILYVGEGELEEIEDLDEVNDGDPAVLQHFVEACIANYPAEKYALILRNHGGAFTGACWDDTDKHDALTLAEIQKVLAVTAPKVGGKFDLVGFDMCLCANLETAHAVAPYAKYLSASEDLAYGSNYTMVMKRFLADPSMDGAGLAGAYVEAYEEQHGKMAVATYSAIDLSRIPALVKAVGELARVAGDTIEELGEDAWYKFAEVQSNAEEYGTQGGKSTGLHVFDVLQLAALLQETFPDTEVAQAAAAVEQAAKSAIVANFHGADRPNANGLSIYFPVEATKTGEKYAKTPFAGTDWAKFVGRFTGVAAKDETPPEVAETKTDDSELDEKDFAKITSSVKAKDVDECYFVVSYTEGKDEIIMGNLPVEPDGGKLEADWDGAWFTITDGKANLVCPVTDWELVNEKEEIYLVEVPVQVRLGGKGDWVDAVLYFRIDFNKDTIAGKFDSAWVDDGEKPYELDLAKGDTIRPQYMKIDEEGDVEWVVSGDDEDVLTYGGAGSIQVGYERMPDGEYRVGFVVYDYAGNADESYVTVKVK